MDYEFRFFRAGRFEALHMTVVDNDTAALERARVYLKASPHFEYAEVRRGFRFLQRVESDFPGGKGRATL